MKRPSPARIRFTVAALAPALAVLAVSVVWSVLLIPDLPDPVATHFGSGLVADGFTSPAAFVTALSLTAAGTAVLFGALALGGMSAGAWARFVAGTGAGSIILLAAMQVAVLLPQAGLADARGFALPPAYFAVPFILAIAGGALIALFVAPVAETGDEVAAADPITLSEASRAVWFGRARASWVLVAALCAGVPALVVPAVTTYRAGETVIAALLAVGALAMTLLAVMFLSVRVRVDAAGVHWSLLPGFPRGSIAYDAIDDVEAVDAKPGDWGGWGYRISGAGTAILLRGGEGLHVKRRAGADFFVSVDDAARGAALAKGFLQRS